MDITTFITLSLIGLTAGIASGYIGIGGGIIIIPALVYFLNLDQYQAQGVSLALMLPPIGILAFYSYYQTGTFNLVENNINYKNHTYLLCLNNGCFLYYGRLDRC